MKTVESGARRREEAASELRVLDLGTVGAVRSQSSWHGIASAMQRGSSPTLSFCRPSAPYVGLGFHRSLDEIDLDACRAAGLPVIRRQIGGGPVYLDADQLFFQVTVPAAAAPARVDRLYERYLEPAAAALRRLGLDVRRRGMNDLAVGGRKISGTGAGRIDGGVTVVGNVLFRFPHERMVRVLALPSESARRECLRLMRRHVASLADVGRSDVDEAAVRGALVDAYTEGLGLAPRPVRPSEREEAAIVDWEKRFADPGWLAGPDAPRRTVRQVKISGDAWMVIAESGGWRVEASIAERRLQRVTIAGLDGVAERMSRSLAGRRARPEEVRRCLAPFGEDGRRVGALLEPGLTLAG